MDHFLDLICLFYLQVYLTSYPEVLSTGLYRSTLHLPHKPWERELLKTLWKKEKMLVTSIFSFSHNVFYPITYKFRHFSHIWIVVCKCFEFGLVYHFVVWKRVYSYHTIPASMTLRKKPFENNMEKGESVGNQQFVHFPHILTISETSFNF